MRFSIRDLLWATVVVAMGLGWWVRDGELRSELNRATAWRTRAGALEEILRLDGWDVRWDLEASHVNVTWSKEDNAPQLRGNWKFRHTGIETDRYEPSAADP